MRFYYHVLDAEKTLTGPGEERVAMDWIPMPASMVAPPRVGETMTIGSIDAEDPLLLKVISVHWEVGPKLDRCLITVVDEEDSMQEEASSDDMAKVFSAMSKGAKP